MDASKQVSKKATLRSSTRKKTTAAGTAKGKKTQVSSSAARDTVLPPIPEIPVVIENESVNVSVAAINPIDVAVESGNVVSKAERLVEEPSSGSVKEKIVETESIGVDTSGPSAGHKKGVTVSDERSEKDDEGKGSETMPKESRVQKFQRLFLEAKLKKIQSSYRPRKVIQKKPKSSKTGAEVNQPDKVTNSGTEVDVQQKQSEEAIGASGPRVAPVVESCPVGKGSSADEVIEEVLKDVESMRMKTTAAPIETSLPVSEEKDQEDVVVESDLGIAGYTVTEISHVLKKRKAELAPSARRITRQASSEAEAVRFQDKNLSSKKAKLASGKVISASNESMSVGTPEEGGAEKGKEVSSPGGVTVKGIWFCSDEASKRWPMVQKKKIFAERAFQENRWTVPDVVRRLEDAGLMKAVKFAEPFCEKLIREFVANISEEFGDILEDEFGKVTVRGKTVSVTPKAINEFLKINIASAVPKIENWHEVARCLTNGKVSKWRGPSLESKYLTSLYSLLQGICIKNWVPVTHRASISKSVGAVIYSIGLGKSVNLGEIIFDQIANQALTKSSNQPICHPSLIYQMIQQQAPEIIDPSSSLVSLKPFTVDWKIFTFQHFVDVTIPPSIHKALQRQGKLSKTNIEPVKTDNLMKKSAVDRVRDHLKLLNQARREMQELLSVLEITEGAQGEEHNEESTTDSDEADDDQE